ncbi:MAG: EamA family transporter [Pseudomonadota bacterium]|nr:EamA family transporter [Pseudomonadota bacterium]
MALPSRPAPAALPWRHALLALAVVAVWGSNFVVIKVALRELPPLLLATLRFAFAFAPAALFIKRPVAPWRDLAVYGMLIGAGQFGLLFIAMNGHISPGLASLVVQTQVVFTIGFSMHLTGERIAPFQVFALILAVIGIGIIALHAGTGNTPLGLAMVLGAALCWAGGNMVARRSPGANMLAYMVWSSLFSIPPLLILSLVFEGWPTIADALRHADPGAWAAVLWQSGANTLFGYAAWAWLLARHPAATITPVSLLVPVFGIAASAWLLAEPLPAWKLAAAALVLGGLALNLLWPRLRPSSSPRSLRAAPDPPGRPDRSPRD